MHTQTHACMCTHSYVHTYAHADEEEELRGFVCAHIHTHAPEHAYSFSLSSFFSTSHREERQLPFLAKIQAE